MKSVAPAVFWFSCGLVLLSPVAARADIVIAESIEWVLTQSDHVVVGKVVKVGKTIGQDKKDDELVTVAVSKTFKGKHDDNVTFLMRQRYVTDLKKVTPAPYAKQWLDEGIPLLFCLVKKDGAWVVRLDNDNRPCAILLGASKHQQTGTFPVLTWDFDVLTEPDAILKRVQKIASFPVKEARPKPHQLDVPFGTAVEKKLRGISAVYLIVPVIPELPGVESLEAAPAPDVDDQARRNELKPLQGIWITQSTTRDGKERTEEAGVVLYIAGDQVMVHSPNGAVMYMEFEVQDPSAKPKHIWFRKDDRSPAAVKTALDQYGAAGFQIDGDTLQLCFRAAKAWPTQISDKEQVLWTLQRKTAAYRKEKLDQLLLGKQIVHCEVIAKKGDKRDGDVQFPECTYLDGKDVHDYFLEPYPKNTSLYRSGPFPKFTKVLHGLRTVRSEKGEVELIENWYAGALHGQQITFRDGRRSSITTYEYGVLHGMYRRYSGGEIWNEENYVDGRRVSARYFHSNGQPSDFWLENVLREERDEKGNLIPTRKIEMQKPHGAWEIVAATQDGKPRAGEKGGELTFVEDDVRVKLPGKKGTMTMNAHLRRPGTLPYLDFHPMVLERRFRCPLDELRYGRYAVDGITLTISFGTVFPRTSATRGRCFGFSRRKQSSPGVLDARTDVVRRKIGLAALDASACAGAASKWTALAVGGKAAQWQRDVANRLVCDKS